MSQVGEKSLVAVQLVSDEPHPVILNNTVWTDLTISGLATRGGASAPDLITFDGSSVYAFSFDGVNRTEEVHAQFQMPHQWKIGSEIVPHVHWSPTSTVVATVVWGLEFCACQGPNLPFSVVSTLTATSATSGVAWSSQISSFGSVTIGADLSCLIMCRLFRNPAATADTYAADAALLALDIHYQIDSLGSNSETTK